MPPHTVLPKALARAIATPVTFNNPEEFLSWIACKDQGTIGTLSQIPDSWRQPLLKRGLIVRIPETNRLALCTSSRVRPLSSTKKPKIDQGVLVFLHPVAA
jgi:hypothetical protein